MNVTQENLDLVQIFNGSIFASMNLENVTKFKKIRYKNNIECHISNPKAVKGKIKIFTKKHGFQNHVIKIYFEKGNINLSTKSKDWTRNFKLKIKKNNSKINII